MLQRLRCVLSPQLNALVHDGTIAPMVALQLDGWVYPRYNELVIGGGDPLVIITKVTPLFVKADCLLPLLTATNLPWAVPGHERRLPLTGHRAYYLAVFDDTSPYGGRWDDTHTDAEESDDEVDITAWNWDTNTRLDIDDVSESAASIDDALKLTNRYHPESRLLAMHRPAGQQLPARRVGTSAQELVFGVIIKKSSLLHYGKKNKHCKCPFNFHVIIQDRERTTAKVTFWTTACPFYFCRLSVGDPIAICRYRIKGVLNQAGGHPSVELAVNPPSKESSHGEECPFAVRKLTAEAAEYLQLDQLPSPFHTLSSRLVCQIQDGSEFDFLGIVSYVGDPHTRAWRQDNSNWETNKLSQWRWIKLRDQCSLHELPVKVFVNSQPRAFENVRMGDVLFLTNITLKVCADSMDSQRSIHGLSSIYSRIYKAGPPEDDLPNLPQALKLIEWAKTARAQSIGNYCVSLMRPFNEYLKFRAPMAFPERRLPLKTFGHLVADCALLRQFEVKWFVINARIVQLWPAIIFGGRETVPIAPTAAGEPPAQPRRSSRIQSTAAAAPVAPGAKRAKRAKSALASNKRPRKSKDAAHVSQREDSGSSIYVSSSKSLGSWSSGVQAGPACLVQLAGLNEDSGQTRTAQSLMLNVVAADDATSAARECAWVQDIGGSVAAATLPPASALFDLGLHPLLAAIPEVAITGQQRQALLRAAGRSEGFDRVGRALVQAVGQHAFVCVVRAERLASPAQSPSNAYGLVAADASACAGVEASLVSIFDPPARE
jgi:hypothetical protein